MSVLVSGIYTTLLHVQYFIIAANEVALMNVRSANSLRTPPPPPPSIGQHCRPFPRILSCLILSQFSMIARVVTLCKFYCTCQIRATGWSLVPHNYSYS